MLARTMAFRSTQAAAGAYSPNGVVFDGTNDYMSRTSAYTGLAATKLWTCCFTLRLNSVSVDQVVLAGNESTQSRYFIQLLASTQRLRVSGRTGGNTVAILLESSISLTTVQWYNVAMSFDTANAANRHLYIDDVNRLGTVTTYSDLAMGFDEAAVNTVGANADATFSQKLNGELADVWFEFGRYVDFSVEANRRKFFTSGGALVTKGSDGSTPFGAAPTGYFGDDNDESNWGINNAGKGDLTVTGTLTGSATDPSGA